MDTDTIRLFNFIWNSRFDGWIDCNHDSKIQIQWRIQDFPLRGAPTRWGGGGGGANLRRIHFLAKMYAKMKEIDPVGGGGGTCWQHPLDLPMR